MIVPGRFPVALARRVTNLDGMCRFLLAVPLAVLLLLPFGESAVAACTDPPGAEADWQRCNFDGFDWSEVNLAGARLREASFIRADLSGADLSEIEGHRVKFINTTMPGVSLRGARLFQADMTKADLTGADLSDTDLREARLFQAVLRDANLTGARIGNADFGFADLSGATWINGEHVCREGSIGRCN